MKSSILFLMLIFVLSQISSSQGKNYSGTFTIADDAAKISANNIKLRVEGSNFSAAMQLRENKAFQIFKDKRDHSGDYTDINGNCSGTIVAGKLEGGFRLSVLENEVGVITKNNPPARIKATISGREIIGQLIVGEEDEEEPFIIPFRAIESGNEKPELAYPAGNSPKVFDKGWIFGASFRMMNEKGELLDLSDEVEWSGTASFVPAKGRESRPVFNSTGANKIILSVTHGGKTYKNEYPVETVSHLLYGHTGSLAASGSDAHGCPGCPHKVTGPVVTGSSLVFAGNYPAARVGDKGVHAACCEHNSFVISTGDPEVLIDGRPAAVPGLSVTTHCGGSGQLLKDISELDEGILMTGYVLSNPDATGGDPEEFVKRLRAMHNGEVYLTGEKGILAFPGNSQASITLFPKSVMKVLEQTKERIRLFLEKGYMLINGNTNADKKVLVNIKGFSITPSGTRFLVSTDSTGETVIRVYEGNLTVQSAADGQQWIVDSGYSFRYSDNKETLTQMEAINETETMRELMSGADNRNVTVLYDKPASGSLPRDKENGIKKSFLQQYGIYLAGAAVLIIIMILLVKKRKKTGN